ncbi:MAG TPA: cytochrome c biogenesis heme-transporting ATPase CcmA [Burkholderiales bacterium]|nr:cytochrome c biogenesis heme-transporting ATPase CcmA [Burkholderiales bacterium]
MLRAESLACERGGRLLFKSLAFTLVPGTLLRVAGPNGAGKTSLLRILCALARPAAGQLLWSGEDAHGLGEEYTRQLLYLGHLSAIKEDLTPRENLRFALRLAGLEAPGAALDAALARLGLAGREAVPARYLSQGQKRRVALARLALAHTQPLWILDEPLAALDVDAIDTVMALVSAHLDAGGMTVLTTHQEVEIASTSASVLRLVLGA